MSWNTRAASRGVNKWVAATMKRPVVSALREGTRWRGNLDLENPFNPERTGQLFRRWRVRNSTWSATTASNAGRPLILGRTNPLPRPAENAHRARPDRTGLQRHPHRGLDRRTDPPPGGHQATSAPSAPPPADLGKITNRVTALALGRNGYSPSGSRETGARSVRCAGEGFSMGFRARRRRVAVCPVRCAAWWA